MPQTGDNPHVLQLVNTLWYIHAQQHKETNYYGLHKKNDNLKFILLNERSQLQNVMYYMIPFIGHSREIKTRGMKTRGMTILYHDSAVGYSTSGICQNP